MKIGCGSEDVDVNLKIGCGSEDVDVNLKIGCGSEDIDINLKIGCGSEDVDVALHIQTLRMRRYDKMQWELQYDCLGSNKRIETGIKHKMYLPLPKHCCNRMTPSGLCLERDFSHWICTALLHH